MKSKLFLLIIFTFSSAAAFSQSEFDVFYKKGLEYERQQQYYKAIKVYTAAIAITSDQDQKDKAKKRINYCANRLEELRNEAILANKKTVEILKALLPPGVDNVYSYFDSLGDYYFYKLGEYEEAVKNYKLAKNAPDRPRNSDIETKFENAHNCLVWQNKALEYLKQEKYDLAEQEIIKVLKLSPEARKMIIIASAINPLLGLVLVQGGEFMMGSEEGGDDERPIHKVYLSSFEISRYEVTNLQYAVFLNRYGSNIVLSGEYKGKNMIYEHQWGVYKNPETGKWEPQKGYEFYPVVNVTWYGAYEFCRFYGLSLPTEAQWEYAAGGGTNILQKWAGTNEQDKLGDYAWYDATSKGKGTFPVGLKKPNALGIYDMSGNVWEWCLDWYDSDYYQKCADMGVVKNPVNIEEGSFRVLRGGSWYNNAYYCRVAHRAYYYPYLSGDYYGFRYALHLVH